MSDIEEQRHAKQTFLKESIIDRGIPPERFQEFLINLKDEPFEIDHWTIDELSNIVDMFMHSEAEAENNQILTNTNSYKPYTQLKCKEIEYIKVGRLFKQRNL